MDNSLEDQLSYDKYDDMENEEDYQGDYNGDSDAKKKFNLKNVLMDLTFYALILLVAAYIIPNYVLQRTIVDGTSMEDTLSDGDNLYVEKISYRFDRLDRFDIIVFHPYGKDRNEYYVKRIIGLPGEKIQIKDDGLIYINGAVLEEDYGAVPISDPGRAALPITIGEDEYFVLGDNREYSMDSRRWSVGNVHKENIGGKVFLRISPFAEFGTVN